MRLNNSSGLQPSVPICFIKFRIIFDVKRDTISEIALVIVTIANPP
jgi:hypothetical protein